MAYSVEVPQGEMEVRRLHGMMNHDKGGIAEQHLRQEHLEACRCKNFVLLDVEDLNHVDPSGNTTLLPW